MKSGDLSQGMDVILEYDSLRRFDLFLNHINKPVAKARTSTKAPMNPPMVAAVTFDGDPENGSLLFASALERTKPGVGCVSIFSGREITGKVRSLGATWVGRSLKGLETC